MHLPTLVSTVLSLSLLSASTALAAPGSEKVTCPTLPNKNHDAEIHQGKYNKISAFVNKLDNVTNEYFDKYWTKCDIPLALDCKEFKENVVKFNLIHQTPALAAEMSALGYPLLAYDGIIEFWVKDLTTWQKVTASECWQGVRADAKTFAKWPFQFMYGYEVLTFDRTKGR